MKRKCIIQTQSILFTQMIACVLKYINDGLSVVESTDIRDFYGELEKDCSLYVILEAHAFSFNLEEVCERIYSINPCTTIICLCRIACQKYFGLRLYRSDVNCIIDNVDNSRELLKVLRNAFEGISYYPKAIVEAIKNREHILNGEMCTPLTERQIEVLQHYSMYKQAKSIAIDLGITEKTVYSTMNRVLKKLGVETKEAAISLAIESGVFSA